MKRLAVLLVSMLALNACGARPAPAANAEPLTPPVELLVDNRAFYDANVYVLVGNAAVRKLGMVTGFSAQRFVLTGAQFAPGRQIALYAKTIAEHVQYNSGQFTINAGMGFRWTLEAQGHEWLLPMQALH